MAKRISDLLASCIATVADGFERFPSRPGSWYRRSCTPLFSFIVVQHSTKYKCFEVDVVSTVFPSWDRKYGTLQLRRSTGLANLRVGSSMIPIEEVAYRYVADPQEALHVIGSELRSYALPWFDAHRSEMDADPIVQRGLAEIGQEGVCSITLEELKWSLRDEAARVGAALRQRKETAILAADLLRWAGEQQRTSRCTCRGGITAFLGSTSHQPPRR